MPQNSNNRGLLSSWKEIARYLDCDERTCRRWEQNFGLPIHRMEGTAKSRVYAYKEELDAWRREKLNGVLQANGKEPSTPKLRGSKATKLLFWLLPLLVVTIAAAVFLFRPSPGQPADFRIQGSKLIVLDQRGKELWAFDTGLANLEDEKSYRERFQFISRIARPGFPYLIIKDLDMDGKTEVVFCPKPKYDQEKGEIFCFGARGEIKWHRKVGREVEFGGRSYSSDYRVVGFAPVDIEDDGYLEILTFSFHNPHSPSQLLILDAGGQILGDFFNFGQMHDILCCDLDGDGKKELLVIGQSDEYGKGCLIAFDASRVGGGSPQILQYHGQGLTPGTENCYLLFPRTDVDRILNPLKEAMHRVELLQNGRIQVHAGTSTLYFELDPQFRLLDIKASDYFRLQHRELKAAGKITSVLDNAYFEELKKNVLYWDGEEWTSKPAMNRFR